MTRKKRALGAALRGGPDQFDSCPCGSRRAYADCCRPLHEGLPAPDAETLMRSRYTAYVVGAYAYLRKTWYPAARPLQLDLDSQPSPRWLGLEVRRHVVTGPDAAIVEFIARYRLAGRAERQHEVSRFLREDGRWYYVDGDLPGSRSAVASPAGVAS